MPTTNEQLNEMHQTIRQLSRTLAQTTARHERAMHRQRWFLLLVAMLFAVVLHMARSPGATVFAQVPTQLPTQAAQLDPQTRAAMRETLIDQLPEETRQRLAEFEQQVEWLGKYMQTWDEEQAGAVVALMLKRIGDSMDAVPKMHQEMQVMNSLMNSMPIVAAEMQRMNANMTVITANMGVMTHNMDSTMGRMGRSMPWAPW